MIAVITNNTIYQLFLFKNLYLQSTYCLGFIRTTLNCVYSYFNGSKIITISFEIINIKQICI